MRYDKFNRKQSALEAEIGRLRQENAQLRDEAQSIEEILDETLHEVRRFSAQLSRFAERLRCDTENQPSLNQTALSIFYTAGMISSRLAYTDLELNPRALENQTPIRSGIYRKFDKAKKILAEEARGKNVNIIQFGESRAEIDALPVFELLPFVLVENAIKYSPENQSVKIMFDVVDRRQCVTLVSVGPLASPMELPKLFEKGFRGVQTNTLPGQGLGLYLAKKVCEYHDIRIRVESGPRILYQLGGRDYAEFKVILLF